MRSLDLDNPLFQIGLSQSKEQIAIRENELSNSSERIAIREKYPCPFRAFVY